jgi:hypothetical protein
VIRRIAIFLGIIDPEKDDDAIQRVYDEALDTNETARKLIHDSRNLRSVLQLDYELAQRGKGRR